MTEVPNITSRYEAVKYLRNQHDEGKIRLSGEMSGYLTNLLVLESKLEEARKIAGLPSAFDEVGK